MLMVKNEPLLSWWTSGFFFFFFFSPVFVCCLITDKVMYIIENNYLQWQLFFFFPPQLRDCENNVGELNLAKSSLHLSSHERDAYKSHYHKSSLACAAWNITIVGSLFKCQGEPTIFLCLCVTGGWTQIQNGHPWSVPSQPIWRGDSQQGGYKRLSIRSLIVYILSASLAPPHGSFSLLAQMLNIYF